MLRAWYVGKLGLQQLNANAASAAAATKQFSRALFEMCAAWFVLLLPFAEEAAAVGWPLWSMLSLKQRCFAALTLLVGWSIAANMSTVIAASYQLTILPLAATLLYHVLPALPTAALVPLAWFFFLALPTLLSLWVVCGTATRGKSAEWWAESLLLYWAAWPVLSLAFPAAFTGRRPLLGETHLQLFVVLLIWLQLYGGLLFVVPLLERMGGLLQGLLPTAQLPSTPLSYASMLAQAGRLSGSLLSRWALLPALVLVLVLWRLLAAATSAINALVLTLVALDSLDAARKRAVAQYEKKLSFWVGMAAVHVGTWVPVAGGVLTLFQSPILLVLFLGGDKIMKLVRGKLQ